MKRVLLIVLLGCSVLFISAQTTRTAPLYSEINLWKTTQADANSTQNHSSGFLMYQFPMVIASDGTSVYNFLEAKGPNTIQPQSGQCADEKWYWYDGLDAAYFTEMFDFSASSSGSNSKFGYYGKFLYQSGKTLKIPAGEYTISETRLVLDNVGSNTQPGEGFTVCTLDYNVADEANIGNVTLRVIDDLDWSTEGNNLYAVCKSNDDATVDLTGLLNIGDNWQYGTWTFDGSTDRITDGILDVTGLNGLYALKWTATFLNGTQTVQKNIQINTTDYTFILPDQICEGDVVDLYDYTSVSSGVTFSGTGINNNWLTVTGSGTQSITASYTFNSCTIARTDNFYAKAKISTTVSPSFDVCYGESVQLNVTSSGTGFSWSPAAGLSATNIKSPIASPTETTTYTLVVTGGASDCPETKTVTVYVRDIPTITATLDTDICGSQMVSLLASGAGDGGTYVWTPSTYLNNANVANPTATPTETITYTVTGTTQYGCESSTTVKLTVLENVDGGVVNETLHVCYGSSVELEAYGGIFFDWDNEATLDNDKIATPMASPLVNTTYSVLITNEDGCKVTKQVSVIVDPLPVANAGNDKEVCSGENALLSGSGAGVGGTYEWSPITGLSDPYIANPTVNITSNASYTLKTTNANGCVDTDVINLTVNTPGVLTISADNNVTTAKSICVGESVSLRANMTGSQSYSWSPTTNISNPIVQNPTVTPTTSTVYYVTVTDLDGCSRTESINITVNPLPEGDVTFSSVDICKNESVQLQAYGGSSYAWTGGSLSNSNIANPVATPTSTTVYEVKISNANGCFVTKQVVVTVNNNPIAVAGGDVEICKDESVQLTGSGAGAGGTYQWTPSTGLSDPAIANPIASPSSTTTYTLTVTNSNNCSSSDDVVVKVNAPGNVVTTVNGSVASSTSVCQGNQIQLGSSMTNGQSYQWTPTTGLNNPNISNPLATITSDVTYTVTITDSKSCQNSGSVTVITNAKPDGNVSFTEASICSGESIQLVASGGSSYSWTGNNLSNSNIGNPVASPTSTTVYEVTISNNEGCSVKKQIVITVNNNPLAGAGNDVQICEGDETTLFGSGAGAGGTYSWSPTSGLDNANAQNPKASPSSSTTYTLTVTNTNGCTDTDEVLVTVNKPGNVITSVNGTVASSGSMCSGTSLQLAASMTGAQSYTWTPSAGLNNPYIANPIASPSNSTTYTVTVVDSKGCSKAVTLPITVNDVPNGQVSFTSASICTGEDIQLEATGGVTYSWTGPNISGAASATPIVAPTSPATYYVNIYNAQGCYVTKSISINVNGLPNAVVGSNKEICSGSSIQISASGAGGSGSYSWSPQEGLSNPFVQSPTASPTETTTYTVTVINANGCEDTADVTVTVNNPGNVLTYADNNLTSEFDVCLNNTVQLKGTMSGAVSYAWSPAAGLNNTTVQSPIAIVTSSQQTYTVTITDSKGCQNSATIVLNGLQNPVLEMGPKITVCKNEEPIDLRTYANLNGTTFSGNGVSGVMFNPASVSTGITFVTGTYSNGECSSTDQLEISVVAGSLISAGNDVEVCRGSSTQLNASGGSSYTWSPVEGLSNPNIRNPTATPTETTIYTVTVQDASGCIASDQVIVTVAEQANGIISAAKDTYDFGELVSFSFTQYTSESISYNWNLGNGVTSTSATPKFYYYQAGEFTISLNITTASGCTSSFTKTITVNEGEGIVTGIKPFELKDQVYPVPFNSYVNVELGEKSQISVYNMAGEQVKFLEGVPGVNILDTSRFSQGMYLLVVKLGNGSTETLKIFKK